MRNLTIALVWDIDKALGMPPVSSSNYNMQHPHVAVQSQAYNAATGRAIKPGEFAPKDKQVTPSPGMAVSPPVNPVAHNLPAISSASVEDLEEGNDAAQHAVGDATQHLLEEHVKGNKKLGLDWDKVKGFAAHAWEHVKEKVDIRNTAKEMVKLGKEHGPVFMAYAIAIEAFEDIAVPAFLTAIHKPALIPFALAFHTEPVMYPLYFAVANAVKKARGAKKPNTFVYHAPQEPLEKAVIAPASNANPVPQDWGAHSLPTGAKEVEPRDAFGKLWVHPDGRILRFSTDTLGDEADRRPVFGHKAFTEQHTNSGRGFDGQINYMQNTGIWRAGTGLNSNESFAHGSGRPTTAQRRSIQAIAAEHSSKPSDFKWEIHGDNGKESGSSVNTLMEKAIDRRDRGTIRLNFDEPDDFALTPPSSEPEPVKARKQKQPEPVYQGPTPEELGARQEWQRQQLARVGTHQSLDDVIRHHNDLMEHNDTHGMEQYSVDSALRQKGWGLDPHTDVPVDIKRVSMNFDRPGQPGRRGDIMRANMDSEKLRRGKVGTSIEHEGKRYAITGAGSSIDGGVQAWGTELVPREEYHGPIADMKRDPPAVHGIPVTHKGKEYVLAGHRVRFVGKYNYGKRAEKSIVLVDDRLEKSVKPGYGPPYGDPKRKKWPLNTEAHVKAALSYYGAGRGRKNMSDEEWTALGHRIAAAATRQYGVKHALAGDRIESKEEAEKSAIGSVEPPVAGRMSIHGTSISIENPKGSIRSKTSHTTGKTWSRKMYADYGRFTRHKEADGHHVDVYVGPHHDAPNGYIISQHKANKDFDEFKTVIGVKSKEEASKLYLRHYPAGWHHGHVEEKPWPEFKQWLANGQMSGEACPHCGALHEQGDGKCNRCGKPWAVPVEKALTGDPCPHCGENAVNSMDGRCEKCGKHYKDGTIERLDLRDAGGPRRQWVYNDDGEAQYCKSRAHAKMLQDAAKGVEKAIDKRGASQNIGMYFDTQNDGGAMVPIHSGLTVPEIHRGDLSAVRLKPNHVYFHARDFNGRTVGHLSHPYNGTREHAVEVANHLDEHREELPEHSNMASQTGATDEHGKAKWIISPNRAHAAHAGTQHAKYIFGDLDAKPEV